MCNEDGSSLSMDKQLRWSFQSCLFYVFSVLCSVWLCTFAAYVNSNTLPCAVQSMWFFSTLTALMLSQNVLPWMQLKIQIWLKMDLLYHGLYSSASPVFTATGLINGEWQNSTPRNPHPLNWPLKNLSQMITSTTQTAMQIHPWGFSL